MARNVAELEVTADADVSAAERKVDGLGKKVNTTAADTKVASAAFIGMGAAIVGGLGLAIGTAANFEAGISAIGAVSGLTGEQLDEVRNKALELGADTVFSASEAAGAMETLIKAGMPVETVLKDGARAALDLAAATGTDVVTASELMTNAMNVFGEAAGSATEVADLLSGAANASASSVDSLALGFAASALPAKLMGLGMDDLTTALSLFSQNGLQGSDAGTSFKTMLLAMANPTKEQRKLMDELGISFFDAQGNFIGLEGSADQLQEALSGMSQEQRNATLATLFGSDAVRAAGILYDEGAQGVTDMRNAIDGQASAADQARARMDNLKGAIETLKGTAETAMIMLGSQFTPAIQGVAESLQGAVQWFTTLSPEMQSMIGKGAALAAGLLILAGVLGLASVAMGPVVAGLALILSPIGLVVAAIALLFVAYQTNFLGFADGVNAAASWVAGSFDDIGAAINALKGVFDAVWPTIKAMIDAATPGIAAALAGIGQYFTGMKDVVVGAIKLLVAIVTLDFGGMKDAIGQIVGGLKDMVEGQFAAMAGILGALVAATKTLVVAVWNALKDDVIEKVTGLKDDAIDGFTGLMAGTLAIFDAIKANVADKLTGLKDDAIATVTGLKDSIIETLTSLMDDAIAKVGDLASGVTDKLTTLQTDAFNAAYDVGKMIGEGIKSGIEALKDAVMGAAGDIANAAIDKIKGALDIFSPSKITTYFGEMLGAGLVQGMDGSHLAVGRAGEGMADAAIAPMSSAPMIAPVMMASASGPSTVIYQTNHYTVSIDELEDVANAAEFVRSLPTERELVFGGAFG